MRYVKKFETEWPLDDERVKAKHVRVRRREAPMSPRATRKMARADAALLAQAARVEVTTATTSSAPTSPPPPPSRLVIPPAAEAAPLRLGPPPLPIAFPFPFANAASQTTVTTTREDAFTTVRDSWLLPPPSPGGSIRVNLHSLRPREPDPFTLYPERYSLIPR